jgi:hypothetical protein
MAAFESGNRRVLAVGREPPAARAADGAGKSSSSCDGDGFGTRALARRCAQCRPPGIRRPARPKRFRRKSTDALSRAPRRQKADAASRRSAAEPTADRRATAESPSGVEAMLARPAVASGNAPAEAYGVSSRGLRYARSLAILLHFASRVTAARKRLSVRRSPSGPTSPPQGNKSGPPPAPPRPTCQRQGVAMVILNPSGSVSEKSRPPHGSSCGG